MLAIGWARATHCSYVAIVRIVVSGAAGFLGSHLCRALIARGDEVIGFDSLLTGRLSNIDDLFTSGRFTFVHHDVSNFTHVSGEVDAIMHLASPASPKDFSDIPIKIMKVNSLGTHRLLGMARDKDAKFFLASTSEVYGDPLRHPQDETYWGNVNPVGPRSMYDESKRFAEAMTKAYQRQHGIDIRIARIFNTYGPAMRIDDGRVVTNLVFQALSGQPMTIYGDGSQTRSFTYVDDLVAGFVALLDSDYTDPLNLGNPNEFTINELSGLVNDLTGAGVAVVYHPLPQDDPTQRCPDIAVARRVLDWEPRVQLREGLAKTIEYVRAELSSSR